MKLFVLFSLLGLALALPRKNNSWEDLLEYEVLGYHDNVGVKKAAQIKAAEEAIDFDGASRIVGGSAANLGDYPYMGGLVIDLVDGRISVCGSSVLTHTRAVTAAHCWFERTSQARRFTVVLGSLTLFFGGTRVSTNIVRVHDNWNPFGDLSRWLDNDIAIITLPWVTFSKIIGPVALPSGNLLKNNFAGQWVQAAGFGAQSDYSGISMSQTLHHVPLRVIDNPTCAQAYGTHVIDSTICVSGEDRRSTCGGDSGGPLVYNTGSQMVLVGVTSFGFILGCELNWPAGFARVTSFIPWIQAQL